jgi:hypothetical protein
LRQQSLRLDVPPPGYVIDTSALIDLHRVHYAPDVFKSLWTKLGELVEKRTLIAPRQVYTEIKQRDDDLRKWARQHKHMFCDQDAEQQVIVREIMAKSGALVDTTKTIEDADPFVIALAEAGKHTVVCSEKGGMQGHTKIPDVCRIRGVHCVDSLGMFRALKWSF